MDNITGPEMAAIAEELGLAQADVARRLGVSQPAVAGWFAWTPGGPRKPSLLVRHIFACPTCRQHYLEEGKLLTG